MTLKPTQPPKQWVPGRRFPQWSGGGRGPEDA